MCKIDFDRRRNLQGPAVLDALLFPRRFAGRETGDDPLATKPHICVPLALRTLCNPKNSL